MATGEMIPSATPRPIPTPPPPPSPAFANGRGADESASLRPMSRFEDSLTPEERKIIEESMKQADAHIPPRYDPSGES